MGQAKDTTSHWHGQLFKRNPEAATWYIRPNYGNAQKRINLQTGDKRLAAQRALEFWTALRETAGDWEAAKKAIGHPRRAQGQATVGQWIQAFDACGQINVGARTRAAYGRCLRRIAAGVQGITHEAYPRKSDWRSAVDAVPLARLTDDAVNRYLSRELANVPWEEQPRVKRGLHTAMRNARNLFTPKHVATIDLPAPVPLPFAGVAIEPHKPRRYRSKFNIKLILDRALDELPAPQQAALVLMACAGLRKEEADKLMWAQVQLGGETPHIEIRETWCYKPKSLSSCRVIPLAPDVCKFLGQLPRDGDQEFVIEGGPVRTGRAYYHYRARKHFEALGPWLRDHGVDARQPLHALRKEYGSAINQQAGLQAAMELLGHSDISVTSSTYVEHRERVVVGLKS